MVPSSRTARASKVSRPAWPSVRKVSIGPLTVAGQASRSSARVSGRRRESAIFLCEAVFVRGVVGRALKYVEHPSRVAIGGGRDIGEAGFSRRPGCYMTRQSSSPAHGRVLPREGRRADGEGSAMVLLHALLE